MHSETFSWQRVCWTLKADAMPEWQRIYCTVLSVQGGWGWEPGSKRGCCHFCSRFISAKPSCVSSRSRPRRSVCASCFVFLFTRDLVKWIERVAMMDACFFFCKSRTLRFPHERVICSVQSWIRNKRSERGPKTKRCWVCWGLVVGITPSLQQRHGLLVRFPYRVSSIVICTLLFPPLPPLPPREIFDAQLTSFSSAHLLKLLSNLVLCTL